MNEDSAQGARPAREKGRPTLAPTRRRSLPLRVWATYAERDSITAKARAARLPVAEFMRRAALGKAVEVVNVPAVNADTWRELTAIGHHLNRIVRAVERGGGEPLPPDLRDAIASLRAQVDALALGMVTNVPVPLEVTSRPVASPPRSDFEGGGSVP